MNPILPGIFLFGRYLEIILKRGQNGSHKKYIADPDFPRQELSVRGFGFDVALSVCYDIGFLCAYTRRAIQLYCQANQNTVLFLCCSDFNYSTVRF